MNTSVFKGSATAIITPMNMDGSISYKKMEELLEYQISHHTNAIVVAGTTGESACLSDEEHLRLIQFTCRIVNGRIPVIAGAGSNNTSHAQLLCKNAQNAGADALLLVTPYYNKCSQNGLIAHYQACAKVSDLPFILYNIPSRTGVNILPSTYEELLEIPNVTAVKEASGNFSQLAKITSRYRDRLDIYCGNDDQAVSALALGAKGVISVLSNIEALLESLTSDINPVPVKTAMNMMGLSVGPCRLPLCPMDDFAAQQLKNCLKLYQTKIQEDHLDHPKFSSFLYNSSTFRNGTGCSGYGFNCFSYQLTSRHLPFL